MANELEIRGAPFFCCCFIVPREKCWYPSYDFGGLRVRQSLGFCSWGGGKADEDGIDFGMLSVERFLSSEIAPAVVSKPQRWPYPKLLFGRTSWTSVHLFSWSCPFPQRKSTPRSWFVNPFDSRGGLVITKVKTWIHPTQHWKGWEFQRSKAPLVNEIEIHVKVLRCT